LEKLLGACHDCAFSGMIGSFHDNDASARTKDASAKTKRGAPLPTHLMFCSDRA
jgi:hypothetical protein